MSGFLDGQIFTTMLEPSDTSAGVLLLASDQFRSVTGLEFAVDAGFQSRPELIRRLPTPATARTASELTAGRRRAGPQAGAWTVCWPDPYARLRPPSRSLRRVVCPGGARVAAAIRRARRCTPVVIGVDRGWESATGAGVVTEGVEMSGKLETATTPVCSGLLLTDSPRMVRYTLRPPGAGGRMDR